MYMNVINKYITRFEEYSQTVRRRRCRISVYRLNNYITQSNNDVHTAQSKQIKMRPDEMETKKKEQQHSVKNEKKKSTIKIQPTISGSGNYVKIIVQYVYLVAYWMLIYLLLRLITTFKLQC